MCSSRKGYTIIDGVYVQGVSLMIKLLFLDVSSSLCYSNSLTIISLLIFFDPFLMEGFSRYIVSSKSFPSSTCSSSNPVLKYLSY